MRYSVDKIPHELKVPFNMRKCPSAKIILSHPSPDGVSDDELLKNYAYAINGQGKEKKFYAERYGGHGIFNNGGGARCALTDSFQIKGIGVNPLGGRSTPSSYSTGSMGLIEAVREFIWSKVLQLALPHGSPDVVAVMSLDKTNQKSSHTDQRYATIRESTTRIAYLERAFHFKPRDGYVIDHDSLRVKAAIETFASGHLDIRIDTKSNIFPKNFLDSLINLAVKQAEQYAAAKVRRIMHGALTGSNSCIDGGWMDFGSIDHLPSFATTSNFVFGFWGENRYLFESIKNICHSAELHSSGKFNANGGYNYFTSYFDKTYEENLMKNFCYLLGFDEAFVTSSSGAIIHHLVNISRHIAKAVFNQTNPNADCFFEHPSKSVLDLAILCSEAIGCDNANFSVTKFKTLNNSLISDLRALSNAYVAHAIDSGIPKNNAFRALVTTSVRRTAFFKKLNSTEMNKCIKSHSLSNDDLNRYSQMMLSEAAVAFSPRAAWPTQVGSIDGITHHYCPSTGIVVSDANEHISIDEWCFLVKKAPEMTKSITEITEKALGREDV
ncbi:hypothetical protein LL962_08405 [Xanthomonas sp. NCPPB 1067]|uniref:hypothetical protein n=1 Tax=Xanthomonas TaxID=338 RepID=UPI001E4DCA36|nr:MULTISPECIES: hypothetical protein [Xanthomonas]MCC4587122.1 hypothetical protein [Xanthomonas sp. NCPPB 1067]MCD0278868.1 hypothetical protein [Xanthomonas melonis]